jgi:hypothetical protein
VTQHDETEQAPSGARHAAPEGAAVHPLIDLDRDPTPGKPDHADPSSED